MEGRAGPGGAWACADSPYRCPALCPADGFVNTDFPPGSHPHTGAITGSGWEEGRCLGPRKSGSVGLFIGFFFSPNAKMTQYYKTATTEFTVC